MGTRDFILYRLTVLKRLWTPTYALIPLKEVYYQRRPGYQPRPRLQPEAGIQLRSITPVSNFGQKIQPCSTSRHRYKLPYPLSSRSTLNLSNQVMLHPLRHLHYLAVQSLTLSTTTMKMRQTT